MTRKTFREKLGIFLITLGVLGGLYGLFSSLAQAASREEGAAKENVLTQKGRLSGKTKSAQEEELQMIGL